MKKITAEEKLVLVTMALGAVTLITAACIVFGKEMD